MARRGSDWREDLVAGLNAARRLIGPPVGNNGRLAHLLEEIVLAIQRMDGLSERDFLRQLNALARSAKPDSTKPPIDLDAISKMPLEEVEARIRDADATKEDLLAIVGGRFGSGTGALRRLSKASIVERLNTMVRNERAHEAISRVAEGRSISDEGEADRGEPGQSVTDPGREPV